MKAAIPTSIPLRHWEFLCHGTARVKCQDTEAMRIARRVDTCPIDNWIMILGQHGAGCGKSWATAWMQTRLVEGLYDVDHKEPEQLRENARRWLARPDATAEAWLTCADIGALRGVPNWQAEELLTRFRDSRMLVLNDLGTEPDPGVINALLDWRWRKKLLTVVSTNLCNRNGKPSSEFEGRYDGRVISRLKHHRDKEDGGRISAWRAVRGPDLRGQAKPEVMAEEGVEYVSSERIDELFGGLRRRFRSRRDEGCL